MASQPTEQRGRPFEPNYGKNDDLAGDLLTPWQKKPETPVKNPEFPDIPESDFG